MGKTIKKNQQTRTRRTATSGAFVVRGKRFELAHADSESMAEFLRARQYPVGTIAKFKGGEFRLERDAMSGDYRMVKVA